MKRTIPARIADICDLCQREVGYLTKCLLCKKEFCLVCNAIMCNCIVKPDLCRNCGKLQAVDAIVMKFVAPLQAILKKRDVALRRVKLPAMKGRTDE